MKHELEHPAGADDVARIVWHAVGDDDAAARDDAFAAGDVALLRGVDAALRGLAASESPDALEMRRMRDAAIRTTRLHAVEAMNRRTLSYGVDGGKRLPKWPFAAAAAAAAIAVVLVTWLANSAPAPTGPVAVNRDFDDFRNERDTYGPLLAAFNPVDATDGAVASALDDLDSQVSAIEVLGTGTAEN